VVGQGTADEIELTIDAVGLDLGDHAIDLLVSNSAGQPVVVPIRLTVSNTISTSPLLPGRLMLEQNHPNPFNPQTSIGFALPAGGQARLKIYSATGHLVCTLVDEVLGAGYHQHQWDGTDSGGRRVASGVYLYRLETPDEVLTRKLIMVK